MWRKGFTVGAKAGFGKLLLGLLLCMASPADPSRAADIRDTKHNLASAEAPGGGRRKAAAEEVCVFCHTPTLAEQQRTTGVGASAPPRWQGSAKIGHEYTLFDDIGRAGYEGVAVVGSVSVACLSCHDEAQAFSIGTDGAAGNNREHPFGVPYRGLDLSRSARERAKAAIEKAGWAVAAKRVLAEEDFRESRSGVVNKRLVWWASADANSVRRTKNDLPLYPRMLPDGDEIVPFIECTSCHDPHTTNALFLRLSNRGARLCLTCHTK